jgi:hypothetical protein
VWERRHLNLWQRREGRRMGLTAWWQKFVRELIDDMHMFLHSFIHSLFIQPLFQQILTEHLKNVYLLGIQDILPDFMKLTDSGKVKCVIKR